MLNIHVLIFLLLLANITAGCVVLYRCVTTLYNRARYGTDTRPNLEQRQLRAQRKAQHISANTAFLRAWRNARQHKEEVVPVMRR